MKEKRNLCISLVPAGQNNPGGIACVRTLGYF